MRRSVRIAVIGIAILTGSLQARGPAPGYAAPGFQVPTLSDPSSPSDTITAIYLSRAPASHEDFTAVFPVARAPLSPVEAVSALIVGPTPEEAQEGYFSELDGMLRGDSECGGPAEVALDGDLATVRFCRAWSSAGVGQDARVTHQLSATLGQFPGIQRVRLLNKEGRCLIDMSGREGC